MPFLQLPPELHLEFAECLTQPCLAALCLVNHKLRNIYLKPLYTIASDVALQWAVKHSNKETLELALEHGGNVNAVNQRTDTLLIQAIVLGHISIAELLLEKGADVSMADGASKTPLHFAVQHGHAVFAKVLLQHGANINALERNENTPLIDASYKGHLATVQVLLENGADIAHTNCRGATAVNIAILKCDLDIIKLLIKYGADYKSTNICGTGSPINAAARASRLDVMKYFFEELGFSDMNTRDDDAWTPLLAAATSDDHLPTIEYLIEHGADLDAVTRNGVSALMLSIRHGQYVVARFLVSKGADVNIADIVRGDTTLIDAAEREDPEIVRQIIQRGADINQTNDAKWTPILQACKSGSLEVVKVLLEYGADPAEPCRCGCGTTPLQGACGQGHVEIVRYLLDLGVSPHTVNRSGQSPIDTTLMKHQNDQRKEILKLLKEKGCVPTPQTGGVF
jgi:ankyrin repeat protein